MAEDGGVGAGGGGGGWRKQQQLSRTLIYFHFNQSERQAENACGVGREGVERGERSDGQAGRQAGPTFAQQILLASPKEL